LLSTSQIDVATSTNSVSNAWRVAGIPLYHIRPFLALGTNYEYNPFASSLWEGMGLTRTMIWLYGHTDDAGWTPVGIGLDHQDQSHLRLPDGTFMAHQRHAMCGPVESGKASSSASAKTSA
ncbi:hypothetical protein BO85DRAFT_385186, partial [Aspergillus piperis CBS 112811]